MLSDASGVSYLWLMTFCFERILVHGLKGVLYPQSFGELLSTQTFHCPSALSRLIGKIATLAVGWDGTAFSSIPVTVSQAIAPYWEHDADNWGMEYRKQPPHSLSAQTHHPGLNGANILMKVSLSSSPGSQGPQSGSYVRKGGPFF